jgi:tetratricopeptide (TPR) repeat protein
MTRSPDLLVRAAFCYAEAGDYAQAARCHEEAGHRLKAAELWEQAKDPARAAECWLREGRPGRAAECLLSIGRYEAAAECFEDAGDLLRAGWTLVTRTRSYATAEQLFTAARAEPGGQDLRRRIGRRLAAARAYGEAAPLIGTLTGATDRLGGLSPAREREEVELWAVTAAELVGRPDLGALVFAASYRAGVPGCADRWQRWAARVLGDTTGVPTGPAPQPAG